jgi:hypothetical protein
MHAARSENALKVEASNKCGLELHGPVSENSATWLQRSQFQKVLAKVLLKEDLSEEV